MSRLHTLFSRYLDNTLSDAEYAEFWQMLEEEGRLDELSPDLQELWRSRTEYSLPATEWNQKINLILADQRPKVRRMRVWRYAAAVLVIISGALAYNWLQKNDHSPEHIADVPAVKQDVTPGTNGAILTFSNGKTIVLDTARNGQLTEGVTKNDGSVAISGNSVEYATLTTPRGKQQQLVLHDGTKVWLNAASSIRFPSSFTGDTREVEITGEAYFEVAENKTKPFIVHAGQSKVEVLGTHFNVMAYGNENSLQTTLLEGSVKFRHGDKTVLLKPGQQSQLTSNKEIVLIRDADVETAVAWKNGKQAFSKSDIRFIMRQIERWYDIDVEYKGEVPKRTFSGDISRSANLSELLKLLEASDIHFVLDAPNKKLTVIP
jgi:transmembrane sensor